METKLPAGIEINWLSGASVNEIVNTSSGLRIVLAASNGDDRYLEVHLPFVRAFQAMDEGDMLEYRRSRYLRPIFSTTLFLAVARHEHKYVGKKRHFVRRGNNDAPCLRSSPRR